MYSVYESRTNVTEQKYWILLNDLISYKLKYQAKKARLILQSGKYIFFCYLSLCTLFVHCKFCDFLRACEKSQKSQSQLQILQNLRKKFAVMLMSVTQVEPSCRFSKFAKIARSTIFRVTGDFSQSLVVYACAMS